MDQNPYNPTNTPAPEREPENSRFPILMWVILTLHGLGLLLSPLTFMEEPALPVGTIVFTGWQVRALQILLVALGFVAWVGVFLRHNQGRL